MADGEYENAIGTGQVHLWFDRLAHWIDRKRESNVTAESAPVR